MARTRNRDRHPSIHLPTSSPTLLELRAAQRTFEGAYVRTALSQFSFSLVILKIFSKEFYPIGALFAAFGACILLIAWIRRREGNEQFWDEGVDGRRIRKFRTSGNAVGLVGVVSLGVYAGLIALVWRL